MYSELSSQVKQAEYPRNKITASAGSASSPLSSNSDTLAALRCERRALYARNAPDHSLGKGLQHSIGADVPNHNEGYTSVCGRQPDRCRSTTPTLSPSSDSFVGSPVTSGGLPRPPEVVKAVSPIASAGDVFEGLTTGDLNPSTAPKLGCHEILKKGLLVNKKGVAHLSHPDHESIGNIRAVLILGADLQPAEMDGSSTGAPAQLRSVVTPAVN